MLLLFIFLINSMASDCASQFGFSDPGNLSRIELEGSDMLRVPIINLSGAANGTYPSDRLPVYSLNQSIKGTISSFEGSKGSQIIAGSKIAIHISPFNISEYLSGFRKDDLSAGKDFIETVVELNGTREEASFNVSKKNSGMYTVYAIDENRSNLLSAQPFLVTDGETVLRMEDRVLADEPFIRIGMNTTASGNQSKFFAAIMIPHEDYDNISLSLISNESTGDFDSILSLGSKSLRMKSPFTVSSELLMNMLPLLPPNSAIGLQESTEPGVDLILLADKPWEIGQYVLTCVIYSPGKGLLGIRQEIIEVV